MNSFRICAILSFFLLIVQPCYSQNSTVKESTDVSPTREKITIAGYEFQLPAWISSVKEFFVGPSGVFTQVKKFINGDTSFIANMFGTKMAIRANIPQSQAEATKSVSRFFGNLRDDATTRILFVIYINLVIMFVSYTLLLVWQLQAARRESYQRKQEKKYRKLEEEDKRTALHPDVRNGEVEMTRMETNIEEQNHGSESSDAECQMRDSGPNAIVNVSPSQPLFKNADPPRLLMQDMFSPDMRSSSLHNMSGSVNRSSRNSLQMQETVKRVKESLAGEIEQNNGESE